MTLIMGTILRIVVDKPEAYPTDYEIA